MPWIERDGARVWWCASSNAASAGDAVVLLMGLGCSSDLWHRVAPALAAKRRVILLDARGIGRTDVPGRLVHRIQDQAADVNAVLDAAGERAVHVVGYSMGGMVAQEVAAQFPERVRSLTLLGTHGGASTAVRASPAVLALMTTRAGLKPMAMLEAMQPHVYARRTPVSRIQQDHRLRLRHYPTAAGYQAQLDGLLVWSGMHRLASIAAPTLVIHGLEDGLVPPANGERLAQGIPNARLELLQDASHWLMTDQTQRTLRHLQSFLSPAQRQTAS